MESLILVCFYAFLAIWVVSLCNNLIYFITTKSDEFDSAFFNKTRSFSEALDDLHYLEKGLNKQFNSARNKIHFYKRNADLTRRKYSYYADKIEDGFIRLYLSQYLTKKEVFSKLDRPVRWHFNLVFVFVGIIIGALILYSGYLVFFDFNPITILINSVIAAFCVYIYMYIVSLNMLFFYFLVNFILYVLQIDCSKLYKNLGIMNFLTKNWSGFNGGGMAIGAGAVGSFHSYGGDGFGGYGGGSFGGGGAGGSW